MRKHSEQALLPAAEAAVSCLRVADDWLERENPPENAQTLVFEEENDFVRSAGWRGKADFSARVTFGWNRNGLCFCFDVADSEVVNEKPDVDLWKQDSVEIFLAAPEGKRFGNREFLFERVQLILSPPDAEGLIRSFTLYDSAYGPSLPFTVRGGRTPGGYRIRLCIPWAGFGDCDLRLEGVFRMQFCCNDWDRRDGDALPPRRLSVNRAVQPSASAADYPLFRLCETPESNPAPSLELVWNPAVPRLMETDSAEIIPRLPGCLDSAELSIQDFSGRELRRETVRPEMRTVTLSALSGLDAVGLRFVFTGYAGGKALGTVVRNVARISGLLERLAAADWSTLSPWRCAGWMSLVSAVEFLRLAATPGSMGGCRLADAAAECEGRLALLEDRPLPPGLPANCRYLELMRGFAAQLNVAYSRGGRPEEKGFIAVSLPWGNIPCVNAEINCFDTAAEAEAFLRETTAYLTPSDAPAVAGADSVHTGRGHLEAPGLAADLEADRLLSLYSPDRPRCVLRLVPDDAFAFPVEAVAAMPDAPEAMRERLLEFARNRSLPVIPFREKDRFRLTLIAGTPDYPEIAFFPHSRNGLPNDFLAVRRGTDVIRCGYDNRELGRAFVEFILAGRPLTPAAAARFAALRASAMPVPGPEDFAAARELRTGDTHTHTIFSDGQSTPAGLLAAAPAAGFDFLVISDHDEVEGARRLAENMRVHRCRLSLLAGQEITLAPRYHINVYPLSRRIDDRFSWPRIRAAARRAGAVTQLNHPMTYGTGFSALWYGDFTRAGFDAVERRIEHLEKWRRSAAGKIPAVTGSTDTHIGIFGYYNCTAVIAPDFSGKALAEAVRAGRSAMLDPFLPELAYGDPAVCRAVAAALVDPETPQRFGARLTRALADFDAAGFIADSETAPSLPPPPSRPRESFNLEPPETLELGAIPENNTKTEGQE